LRLHNAYITAAVHCAPPGNKPTREEILTCRNHLERELDLLENVKVVVALGRVAFDDYLSILRKRGVISRRAGFVFGHIRAFFPGPGQPVLISSYHPSQQNTQTGKLTQKMFAAVFRQANRLLGQQSRRRSAPPPKGAVR